MKDKEYAEYYMDRLRREGKITVTYSTFQKLVNHSFQYCMDDIDIKLRDIDVIIEHYE